MSSSRTRRVLAALAAGGAGVVLASALAPSAQAAAEGPVARVATADSTWFVDPRTPAERRAAVAVPEKPRALSGRRLQETRAVYRTHSGDLAVPMRTARGHTMVEGQAVTLDGNGLFEIGRTELTGPARTQIAALAGSLAAASSVRCEGYADYAGTRKGARANAAGRATAVCDLLAATNPGMHTTTRSYGRTWPAVVGGTPGDRDMNRRVVVEMTGTTGPAPQPPTATATTPGAPSLEQVRGSVGTLTYEFTAPTQDGGSPITGYEVSSGSGWTAVVPTTASTSSCADPRGCPSSMAGVLTDLPAGVTQHLQVRAVNAVGAGAPSHTVSAVAYGYPGVVGDLTAVGGDASVEVSFTAPASDGGAPVRGYEISFDGGAHFAPVTGTGPTWRVQRTDLANGTTYDVVVRAYNDWGRGTPASASVLAATVPDAPGLRSGVEAVGTTATLTFEDPQLDGGSRITGYEISYDHGATWAGLAHTPDPVDVGVSHASLTSLTLGHEYTVAVRALNDRGAGPRSEYRTFTPAVAPDQPTHVVATATDTTVTLTFDAPAFDGGAAVVAYELSVDGGAWNGAELVSPSVLSLELAHQSPGAHTYAVRAVNRVGHSAAGTSNQVLVVPTPTPAAPTVTNYGYYGAGQQVAVLFIAGADNGATVTGFEMSVAGGPWLPSVSVLNGNQAMFDCPGMTCGWNYGSSVRLRAVTSTGATSEASAPYASNPF